MATAGETISNPRTGQRMTFLELGPERLRIDSVNPPTEEREPLHTHPRQTSGNEVKAGKLVFEVEGEITHVGAGEAITIPAGARHRFWPEGEEVAHSIAFFEPALDTAAFFETLFELARRDELDAKGMPHLMQLLLMVPAFEDEIRPVSPPWAILKPLAKLLGPVARLRGYEPSLPYTASA